LLILDAFTTRWFHASNFVLVYGGSILVMSLITFVTYWIDKRRAQRGIDDRRIPESTLHVLSLMGGWPGAIVAQETFRHKTRKTSFRIMMWVTIFLHGIGITWSLLELKQKFTAKPAAANVRFPEESDLAGAFAPENRETV
jgi:uncharacterized membrane protein YsdA (DUF1294 family)